MSVSWRNAEGYYDPTAGAALSNIERERRAAKKAKRPRTRCKRYPAAKRAKCSKEDRHGDKRHGNGRGDGPV